MKQKSGFQMGLSFGIIMTIWFFIQNVFLDDDSGEKNWLKIIVATFIGGLVAGLFFGFIMSKIFKSKGFEKAVTPDLQTNEAILFDTPANHFIGMEAVGGWLYLTDKNLIFKSHQLNIQNHQLIIPLADIAEAKRYRPLWLTSNGLKVLTTDGRTEKFVVDKADDWVPKLTILPGEQTL